MIAREGWPFILIGLFLVLLTIWGATRYNSNGLFVASLIFGLLTIFTTFFFRDPNRTVPDGATLLVAPADGKIIQIIELPNHPFIGGSATQISIFLSVFDVHINRVPVSGKVEYVKYNPGKFMAAWEPKASLANEQTEIGLVTADGQKVVFKQIAGLIARRIVCRLVEGDMAVAGERFGLIRFGSRTDLIVSARSRLEVKEGDRVLGGESVIGYLERAPLGEQDNSTAETTDAEL